MLKNGSGRNLASFSESRPYFHHWYHEAGFINPCKLNAKIIFENELSSKRTEFFFFFWIIIGLRKNPEARVGGAKIRFPSLWGEKTSSHGLHHQQLLDMSSSHQEPGERGTQTTHNWNQEDGEAGTQSTRNQNQEHAEAGAQSTHIWKQSDKIWPGPSIPMARKCTLLGGPDIPVISPLLQLLRSHRHSWRSSMEVRIHPFYYGVLNLLCEWLPQVSKFHVRKRRKWSRSSTGTGTTGTQPLNSNLYTEDWAGRETAPRHGGSWGHWGIDK